ncbi:MAG: hypothetical protein Q7U47_03470, partial [Paludibacter sp.]|nr:hypothetical protein [Paludibacter sp.]
HHLTTTYGPIYNYYRKDHLGNNREVWNAVYVRNGTTYAATTVQRTHYYPSGLPWNTTTGLGADVQNKKYNGKEWVEMHGLDVSDLGWRTDYNAINRFTTRDRKAEEFPWQSPYCVANNNTVKYIDKNGEHASDPETGGTPATETPKKITTAQSTARQNTPEKIKPIQLTPAQKLNMAIKTIPVGTISKAPSSYEKQYNLHTTPTLKPLIESSVTRAIATGGVAVIGAALAPSMATLKAAGFNATVNTLGTANTLHNSVNMTAVGLQTATGSTAVGIGAATGTIQSFLPIDAPIININPMVDNWSNVTQLIWGTIQITNNTNQ